MRRKRGRVIRMRLEPQNLQTPPVSDAATDADSSGNGHCFLMTSTATQPTDVGADLCMVGNRGKDQGAIETEQVGSRWRRTRLSRIVL